MWFSRRPAARDVKPIVSIDLDPDGVPVSDYGTVNGKKIGRQRSIVAIAEKGLDYWNQLIGDRQPPILLSYSWDLESDLRTAPGRSRQIDPATGMLNCARWLCNNVDSAKGYAVWRYSYPSFFGTQAGWRSAHAQGQAIRLLLRVYQQTGEQPYLDLADRALMAFFVSVDDDGITEKINSRQWWYHKFADNKSQQPRVLNGMLFAMLGLQDMYAQTKRQEALSLLELGTEAVLDNLWQYDLGSWSAYTTGGRRASRHYHAIHCRQLDEISGIAANDSVQKTLQRWNRGLAEIESP